LAATSTRQPFVGDNVNIACCHRGGFPERSVQKRGAASCPSLLWARRPAARALCSEPRAGRRWCRSARHCQPRRCHVLLDSVLAPLVLVQSTGLLHVGRRYCRFITEGSHFGLPAIEGSSRSAPRGSLSPIFSVSLVSDTSTSIPRGTDLRDGPSVNVRNAHPTVPPAAGIVATFESDGRSSAYARVTSAPFVAVVSHLDVHRGLGLPEWPAWRRAP
jgi:hypothetical protein